MPPGLADFGSETQFCVNHSQQFTRTATSINGNCLNLALNPPSLLQRHHTKIAAARKKPARSDRTGFNRDWNDPPRSGSNPPPQESRAPQPPKPQKVLDRSQPPGLRRDLCSRQTCSLTIKSRKRRCLIGTNLASIMNRIPGTPLSQPHNSSSEPALPGEIYFRCNRGPQEGLRRSGHRRCAFATWSMRGTELSIY